jgi:hypothetical protein
MLPIYKKGAELSVAIIEECQYIMLPNIILSRLTPYVDVITGNHKCGFRHIHNGLKQRDVPSPLFFATS